MTDPTTPATATNGYNPNAYTSPYPNPQRTTFLRRIIIVFISCITILAAIVFITWLILRPKSPHVQLQTLTLSNFSVTSNSVISGNWNAGLTVRNPNSKITLFYDHIEATVFYRSNSIASTTLPPFEQGKKNETAVTATFVSSSQSFNDRDEMNRDRAGGMVNFNLRMVGRVRFKAGAWRSRRRGLIIYCPNLSVSVSVGSTGGVLTGGSKHCRVG